MLMNDEAKKLNVLALSINVLLETSEYCAASGKTGWALVSHESGAEYDLESAQDLLYSVMFGCNARIKRFWGKLARVTELCKEIGVLPPFGKSTDLKDCDVDYKVIAFDLDCVLAEYHEWEGDEVIGDPNPGMKELLQELKALGWKIIVFTTRGREPTEDWCYEWSIPFTWINENPESSGLNPGKPVASIYVDDRAIQFDGDVEKLRANIANFKCWQGKMREEFVDG